MAVAMNDHFASLAETLDSELLPQNGSVEIPS